MEPDWEGRRTGAVLKVYHTSSSSKQICPDYQSLPFRVAFSTQETSSTDSSKACGELTKKALIKRNIQASGGMQIINRLIRQGWVEQRDSETDKRSKVVKITQKGIDTLEQQMDKIRQATNVVTGDLTYDEKMELIRLLNKLKDFHHPIYTQHLEPDLLLQEALKRKSVRMLN